MSQRNKKSKKLFIDIIHGNKYENHRIVINERVFKLNNIDRWKLYLKLILQHVNYLCEINGGDVGLLLQEVIKEVEIESDKFKRKMNFLLGDWGRF